MMSLYWVHISAFDCDPWEELEDEITFLVKSQSLPHIPLKQRLHERLIDRETQLLTRVFSHDV